MKKSTVPMTRKLITALRKFPYATPFQVNSAILSTPAALKAGFKISGVIISFTNEVTIAPKAAPIITATAKSTTFPRSKKFFNSFKISISFN